MAKFLRNVASLFVLLVGCAGVFLVLYAWRLPPFVSPVETTNDAYVRGKVTFISPQLEGYIAEVPAQDFQEVKAGQLLVRIDDRIYRQKLDQALAALAGEKAALAVSDQERLSKQASVEASEAGVARAEADLNAAEANWKRTERLLEKGVAAQKQADDNRAAFDRAKAALHQANATLEVSKQDLASTVVNRRSREAAVQKAESAVRLAEIDLQNTRITAPQHGRLGEVGARIGEYVSAGVQLMTLVPEQIWVTANFKETQLAGMKVGQPATFSVDALRDAVLHGHIESFSPATSSEFSVLKPENATGNFIKVARRLPIRIAIDPGQALVDRLAPGMSVVVTVDTAAK